MKQTTRAPHHTAGARIEGRITPSASDSLLGRIESCVCSWYDLEPQSGALFVLLGGFTLLWLVFQIISYAAIDLHPDPLEMFAWSRHPSAGYFKHPPLGAWMVAIWFSIFPMTNWSFQLFSGVNAAIALYFVYKIARLYVAGDTPLFVILLLMLTPFYQFNAQRFGANQVLLSLWPIATYCFPRAFMTRALGWSAAAGIAAALAVLGKFFSIFLVVAFVAAAAADPRRSDYLKSTSPWISAIAGLAVLIPHLHWLITTGYQPMDYALHAHQAATFFAALLASANYVIGGILYMLLPTVTYLILVRPDWRVLIEAVWPSDPDRRLLAMILWTSLGVPAVVAPVLRTELVPLWTIQGWFLFPILLVAPVRIVLTRLAAVRLAIAVLLASVAILLSAPANAWVKHIYGTQEGRGYFRAVAAEVSRLWHETMAVPLTIVDGDSVLATAVTFYSSDRPDYIPNFNLAYAPWMTAERLDREGFAIVCRSADSACMHNAQLCAASYSDARIEEVAVVPRLFGTLGAPKQFTIVILPPRWSAFPVD